MATVETGTFGELLRRYRVTAGLSQEALAEAAGLSPRRSARSSTASGLPHSRKPPASWRTPSG